MQELEECQNGDNPFAIFEDSDELLPEENKSPISRVINNGNTNSGTSNSLRKRKRIESQTTPPKKRRRLDFNECEISKISLQEFKIEGLAGYDVKGVIARKVKNSLKRLFPRYFDSFKISTQNETRILFSLKTGKDLPTNETVEAILRQITGYTKAIYSSDQSTRTTPKKKRKAQDNINFNEFNITESKGIIRVENIGNFNIRSLKMNINRSLKKIFPTIADFFNVNMVGNTIWFSLKKHKILPTSETLESIFRKVTYLNNEKIITSNVANSASDNSANATKSAEQSPSLGYQLPQTFFGSTTLSPPVINPSPMQLS